MSSPSDSLYPPDWVEVARKDWHRIEVMLADGDAEGAGFFLQQSLEKHLKAFLLARGWRLRRIHELDALLDEAVKFQPDLESFRDLCERASGYYSVERYPSLLKTGLTCQDVKKDFDQAKGMLEAILGENP